jgi:hypothetical protein
MCECQVVNGTHYNKNTPPEVIEALERLRLSKDRCRVWYGEAKTGKVWDEEYDVCGTVGRSTGSCKIPLLIANARSMGGPGLLDHCIVRIDNIYTRRTVYQAPGMH